VCKEQFLVSNQLREAGREDVDLCGSVVILLDFNGILWFPTSVCYVFLLV
jgi:hypothetical protein